MRRHGKVLNVIVAVMAIVTVSAVALPVLASDQDYKYSYSFDYGNLDQTTTEWKNTTHDVIMYCEDGEFPADFGYSASVYTSGGISISADYSFHTGTFRVFDCGDVCDTGVYIKGALNAFDAAGYWGWWNPDNPDY